MSIRFASLRAAAFAGIAMLFCAQTMAQSCTNRGDLDVRYCDENKDLLADAPKDPKQWQDPATLVFSYTPVEDPSVYENVFEELLQHIAKVTGKRVKWFPAESYAAQVEAMRSGRLHIAGVATGPTPYAVNLAGFLPLIAMQHADGSIGYTLQVIVRKDSPITKMADLKGKRVAHVTPSSNSGDTAPRVLFKQFGIEPGKDYEVVYSGKHDNSIMGVVNGDYEAAPIASTVKDRMQARGMFKPDALRVIYESRPFPRASFGIAHDLAPQLQAKIKEAFMTFDFKQSKLAKEFKDVTGFKVVEYDRDWKDVRMIQAATGIHYTQDSLKKLGTKE